MLYVYPDGNVGDPESDRIALKEAIKILTKEKIKENNMKNFIEVINTDDERILINVSNIVKVDEMNEYTNKVIKDLKKTTDNLEFIAKLIGEDFDKEIGVSIDAASKAKTMITLNGAWTNQNSSTMIYTNETYDEICKKIGEVL